MCCFALILSAQGIQLLYGLKSLPSPLEMEALTQHWRPYRSVGSYYMWRIPCPPATKANKNSSSSSKRGRSKSSSSNGTGSSSGKKLKGVCSITAIPKGTQECFAADARDVEPTLAAVTGDTAGAGAAAAVACPLVGATASGDAASPAERGMKVEPLLAGAGENVCTPSPRRAAGTAAVDLRGQSSALPAGLGGGTEGDGTATPEARNRTRARVGGAGSGGRVCGVADAAVGGAESPGYIAAGGVGVTRRSSRRLAARAAAAGATSLERTRTSPEAGEAGTGAMRTEMSPAAAAGGEIRAGVLPWAGGAGGRGVTLGVSTESVRKVLREGWVPRELDF